MSNDAPAGTPAAAVPKAPRRTKWWLFATLVAVATVGLLIWRPTPQLSAPRYKDSYSPVTVPEPLPAPTPSSPVEAPVATAPTSSTIEEPPPATAENAVLESLTARMAGLETQLAAMDQNRHAQNAVTDDLALARQSAAGMVALAEQRLLLARDVAGAISALRLAGGRLIDEELAPQRAAVAADIASLEAFKDIDTATLAAELMSLAGNAATLPLAASSTTEEPAPAAAPPGDWRGLWGSIWASLRGLVEIHDTTLADDPLLYPARTALVRQQLALDLSAARVAMLQRDAASLQASLAPAIATLEQRFDRADPGVAAAVRRLREIEALDLAPVLPGLGRSLDALSLVTNLPAQPAAEAGPAAEPATTELSH